MTENKKTKVLVVDDEIDILRILKKVLELKNYEVITASTGKEALERINETIDIVLLDIMLPDLMGYDVCEIIKKNPALREIPVIMLSAKTQMSDIRKGLDIGVEMYITKPFDPFNIPEQLEDILQRKGEKR
ncbi:response regulator [bacterium]|nr:response regulator [bacterium]MBU1153436.1 response regulator [bacterium]